MNYNSINPSGDIHYSSCDYCGAEMEVHIIKQEGHNEKEDYNCPECNKRHYTKASLPIQDIDVKLISPRTDGRRDSYKN